MTRAVYAIEDAFEKLPVHWMWWPAIGGVAVGVIGWIEPRTLGVGYDNIADVLSGGLVLGAWRSCCGLKFVSWSIALGSGTSGGTLAPLFTIGGGLGALLGAAAAWALPWAGVDVRIAALVGMAAMFAGASRAFLASVVFAFETTLQPLALLPLLARLRRRVPRRRRCSMPHSIMTEKIARRGVRVPIELRARLPRLRCWCATARPATVIALRADQVVRAAREWLTSGAPGARHQGFPVLDAEGALVGVVTAREIEEARDDASPLASLLRRTAVVAFEDESLRAAADRMIDHDVGRLPVVSRRDPQRVVAIVTRSDLLGRAPAPARSAAAVVALGDTRRPRYAAPVPDQPVALVTGAARGIGAACARALAAEGFRVAIHCNASTDAAEKLAAELPDAFALRADLADARRRSTRCSRRSASAPAASTCSSTTPALTRNAPTPVMKLDDYDAVAALSRGTWYLTKLVLRKFMMKQKAGRIIMISSVVGHIGNRGQSPYTMAKAGLDALTRSLARRARRSQHPASTRWRPASSRPT